MSATYVLRTFGGVLILSPSLPPPPNSIPVTWKTRDNTATWKTRDCNVTWLTRDEYVTWRTRG